MSELAKYAEDKYHIREEHKWAEFPGFSVLADPQTGKWAALLMRQWDYERGEELFRCDIKCGRQCLAEFRAPYLTDSFRMKGNKWVGVMFGDRTDPEVVFELFDRAVRALSSREWNKGATIVLDSIDRGGGAGRKYGDTLLPLEHMRGNYQRRSDAGQIPPRILEMMHLYEYGSSSFEHKWENFCRQGRYMEDYEDDAAWSGEIKRYFTTYHDLNLNQLRGYFAWRTLVRKGIFRRITTSLAYMYVYELLNGIGTASPGESLLKMKEFEEGYLDSGIGDPSMRGNIRRWRMEYAVLHGAPAAEVLPFIDPALIRRDRHLMILKSPKDHTREEIYGALSALSGGKTEKSSVIRKEPEKGKELFARVWIYLSEHYKEDGWDIFTACFGKIKKSRWHPLANAVYMDREARRETEYVLSECRRFVYESGQWYEIRYDELFFDRYRIGAIMHETDRLLRRYLKTGNYLRPKEGEEWITPYVEAVIEADKEAAAQAAKPRVTIDLSGLDKIRRDAQITRDSLLTEEELREQEPWEKDTGDKAPDIPPAAAATAPPEAEAPAAAADSSVNLPEIPALDELHVQILAAVMEGGSAAELIRSHFLMPSVVTDTINEALFDEIGDNILECDGDEIVFVEDYREEVDLILKGEIS